MRTGSGRRIAVALGVVGVVFQLGCTGLERDTFTELEWDLVESLANPAPPSPCPDGFDNDADPDCSDSAAFGQMIFFEPDFAGPSMVGDDLDQVGESGQVSCASCHEPPLFIDQRSQPRATSRGTGRTGRNAPTLMNVSFYDSFTWTGKWPNLGVLVRGPLENPSFMNSDRLWLARIVFAQYREEYEALFGSMDPLLFDRLDQYARLDDDRQADSPGRKVGDVLDNVGLAIEAYERRLVSLDSQFDRWVADPSVDYPEQAVRGLELFIGPAACIECHSGPMFTDNEFHNTGVAQAGDYVPATDIGRADVTLADIDIGKFRTPSLRNVALTDPYMHTGSVQTLEDVVWFYHQGGDASGFAGDKERLMVPLGLSDQDIADIAAFLRTLDGEPIPMELTVDTSL